MVAVKLLRCVRSNGTHSNDTEANRAIASRANSTNYWYQEVSASSCFG